MRLPLAGSVASLHRSRAFKPHAKQAFGISFAPGCQRTAAGGPPGIFGFWLQNFPGKKLRNSQIARISRILALGPTGERTQPRLALNASNERAHEIIVRFLWRDDDQQAPQS